ncbi:MAG: PAS domain S-box protein, partial [Calditrichota bacterium]
MEDVSIKLLYVEDDLIDQMAFKRMLSQQGLNYQVSFANSIAQAEQKIESDKFDIIITDFNLGDGDAFSIFDLTDDVPIMVATGAGDEGIAVKVIKRGAYDYFVKDANRKYLTTLPVAVEQAVNRHRSDRQFRLLSNALKSINDIVSITDIDGKILFVNQALLDTHRYQQNEVIGEQVSKIFAEEGLPSEIAQSIKDGSIEGWQGETAITISDGRTTPVFLSTSVIRNKHNEPQYLINVANDISERIAEGRALHIEKERLATTLSSIDVAVITTDAAGNILLFNKAAEEVTGWSQRDAVGSHSSEVYRKVKDKQTTSSDQQPVDFVLKKGRPCESSVPTQLINKLGNIKLVTQNATPLKSDDGETVGAVLTFRDVTLQQ